MYNVRNMSGRNLAIMLEKGGSIMRPNAYLDMDKTCSRKWIASNCDFRKLLRTGYLQLVHDSYAALTAAPVRDIRRQVHVPAVLSRPVPRAAQAHVVDLVNMPDVEVGEDKQIHIPERVEAKVEAKVEVNPGIRKIVEWLNDHGFNTCDSGDGKTHDFECDQNVPYVHMQVPDYAMVSESKRLASLLRTKLHIEVQPMDEGCTVPVVEARYNPADGAWGTLTLWNVKLE